MEPLVAPLKRLPLLDPLLGRIAAPPLQDLVSPRYVSPGVPALADMVRPLSPSLNSASQPAVMQPETSLRDLSGGAPGPRLSTRIATPQETRTPPTLLGQIASYDPSTVQRIQNDSQELNRLETTGSWRSG